MLFRSTAVFSQAGDNGEDALIMTTDPLADAATRERIARLRAAVDAAPAPSRPGSEDA